MTYDDPPTPAGVNRPSGGQRCPACGHVEPDAWARFCGVCGGTLGPGDAAAGSPAASTAQLAAVPPEPVARYRPAPPAQPQSIVYTVPSVGLGGAARLGAAVSAAFLLVPCVLFGFAGAWGVHALRSLLASWQTASVRVPVPLVNVDLTMNFVDLLHLRPTFDSLIYWDEHLFLAFAILWLAPWVLGIIAGALFGVLLAAVYNLVGKLDGGVRVTLVPSVAAPASAAVPATAWPSGPPPGSSTTWPGSPNPGR